MPLSSWGFKDIDSNVGEILRPLDVLNLILLSASLSYDISKKNSLSFSLFLFLIGEESSVGE